MTTWRTCNNRRRGKRRAGFTLVFHKGEELMGCARTFIALPNALALARGAWRDRLALARIEASGHDRETGRDAEGTKAGSAPNTPTQQIGN